MEKQLIVALTNPVPGREDEFNDWYSGQHLEEVLTVPGFVAAQRFRVAAERQRPGSPDFSHGYLALVETAGITPRQAWDNLAAARPGMVLSDALADDFRAVMFTPLTPRLTAEG